MLNKLTYTLLLGWRSVKSRWVQTLATLIVIGMALALFVAVSALNEGARVGITQASDPFGTLVIGPKGDSQRLVLSTILLNGNPLGTMDQAIYDELKDDPRTALTVPIAMADNIGNARIIGTTNDFFSLQPALQAANPFALAAGRYFEESDTHDDDAHHDDDDEHHDDDEDKHHDDDDEDEHHDDDDEDEHHDDDDDEHHDDNEGEHDEDEDEHHDDDEDEHHDDDDDEHHDDDEDEHHDDDDDEHHDDDDDEHHDDDDDEHHDDDEGEHDEDEDEHHDDDEDEHHDDDDDEHHDDDEDEHAHDDEHGHEDHVFEAVLGATAAESLGLSVGDEFVSTHGTSALINADTHEDPYIVVGVLERTFTAFDGAVFTPLDAVWDAHAEEIDTAIDDGTVNAGELTAVLVKPVNIADASGIWQSFYVRDDAQAAFPGQELGQLLNTFDQLESILSGVGYLAAAMAGLTVFLTIYSATKAREQMIAVMRGVGAGRGVVVGMVLFEALLIALLGALLARVLGYGSAWLLAANLSAENLIPIPIRFLVELEPLLWGLPVVLALVAGLVPALLAFRVNVVDKLFAQ